MKKILSLILVVCLVLVISVAVLTGCGLFKTVTVEEAKTNLENAGYEVTVISGERYVDSAENPYPFLLAHELNYYLYAVKGDEKIYLYFFSSIDYASDNYTFMNGESGMTSGQSNELVYFATKQAKSDAGL